MVTPEVTGVLLQPRLLPAVEVEAEDMVGVVITAVMVEVLAVAVSPAVAVDSLLLDTAVVEVEAAYLAKEEPEAVTQVLV